MMRSAGVSERTAADRRAARRDASAPEAGSSARKAALSDHHQAVSAHPYRHPAAAPPHGSLAEPPSHLGPVEVSSHPDPVEVYRQGAAVSPRIGLGRAGPRPRPPRAARRTRRPRRSGDHPRADSVPGRLRRDQRLQRDYGSSHLRPDHPKAVQRSHDSPHHSPPPRRRVERTSSPPNGFSLRPNRAGRKGREALGKLAEPKARTFDRPAAAPRRQIRRTTSHRLGAVWNGSVTT